MTTLLTSSESKNLRIRHPETDTDSKLALMELVDHHTVITPEMVVKEAESPDSPLHKHFNWDDVTAAHQHRLAQARTLLNKYRITITYDREPGVPTTIQVPAFMQPTKTEGYITTESALTNVDKRALVVESHKKRLNNLVERLRVYEEFSEVVTAIEAL